MTAGENPFGDLLQDYIVECLPLAEQVADAFVELERRWQSDEPGDDLLTTVKGRLHTIKGNSAMMGIAPPGTSPMRWRMPAAFSAARPTRVPTTRPPCWSRAADSWWSSSAVPRRSWTPRRRRPSWSASGPT